SIKDSAFDTTSFSFANYGSNAGNSEYDYNGYSNASNPFPHGGGNDQSSVAFDWQSGWLGQYYLSGSSDLIDAGSRNADDAGLYHHTSQTDQTREAASIVNLGYHCIALNGGVPWDSDNDGL